MLLNRWKSLSLNWRNKDLHSSVFPTFSDTNLSTLEKNICLENIILLDFEDCNCVILKPYFYLKNLIGEHYLRLLNLSSSPNIDISTGKGLSHHN
jgi:hypothetical protein